MTKPFSGRLYEMPREQAAAKKDDPAFRKFMFHEMMSLMGQFGLTGNGTFMWRAWRCFRMLGEFPGWEIVENNFFRYFDDCSDRLLLAHNPKSATEALRFYNTTGNANPAEKDAGDYWLLTSYMLIRAGMHTPKRDAAGLPVRVSAADALGMLAKHEQVTKGALKQRLLRIQGTGQYGDGRAPKRKKKAR